MLYLKVHRYFFVISLKENYQTEGLYEVPIGLGVRVMVFNATSSYIVAVSFISGGNWSTRRKTPSCCKSLTKYVPNNMILKVDIKLFQTKTNSG
jgi:hypothetical protein